MELGSETSKQSPGCYQDTSSVFTDVIYILVFWFIRVLGKATLNWMGSAADAVEIFAASDKSNAYPRYLEEVGYNGGALREDRYDWPYSEQLRSPGEVPEFPEDEIECRI
jgi:hypothetical protein